MKKTHIKFEISGFQYQRDLSNYSFNPMHISQQTGISTTFYLYVLNKTRHNLQSFNAKKQTCLVSRGKKSINIEHIYGTVDNLELLVGLFPLMIND